VKEIAESNWLGGERPDPVFNRLTDDIHEAVKQFDAVNPQRQIANVLAFVNRDPMCGAEDLRGVLTGAALTTSGEKLLIYEKYALGRIREERFRIDVYLWLEESGVFQVLLNDGDRRHSDRLRSEFETMVAGLEGHQNLMGMKKPPSIGLIGLGIVSLALGTPLVSQGNEFKCGYSRKIECSASGCQENAWAQPTSCFERLTHWSQRRSALMARRSLPQSDDVIPKGAHQ
jgi:hypothetical protein